MLNKKKPHPATKYTINERRRIGYMPELLPEHDSKPVVWSRKSEPPALNFSPPTATDLWTVMLSQKSTSDIYIPSPRNKYIPEAEYMKSSSVHESSSVFQLLRMEVKDIIKRYEELQIEHARKLKEEKEAELARQLEAEQNRIKEMELKKQQEAELAWRKQMELEKLKQTEELTKQESVLPVDNQNDTLEKPDSVAVDANFKGTSNSLNVVLDKRIDEYIQCKLKIRAEWKHYLATSYLEIEKNIQYSEIASKLKKKFKLAVNKLALTQAQIDSVQAKVIQIMQSSEALNNAEFTKYTLCCFTNVLLDNANVQLLLNSKSLWAFVRLIYQLSSNQIFFTLFESLYYCRCTYIVPYYVLKPKSMSQTEFENNRDQLIGEDSVSYCRRMALYVALWLSLIGIRNDGAEFWGWFARFVTIKARKISAFLLSATLKYTAFIGLQLFPTQFRKLLNCIQNDYLKQLEALVIKDTLGAIKGELAEINRFFEEYRKTGEVKEPEGYIIKKVEANLNPNV